MSRAMPSSSLALFIVGAILLLLGAFVAFTTGRMEAILYAILGAAIAVGLAFFLRKNRMRPLFEPREPGERP